MTREKSQLLGERLSELRKKRGISVETLREELLSNFDIEKISSDSLSNYEIHDPFHTKFGSNRKMRLDVLVALADYYGVSMDYLLGNSEISTPDLHTHAIIYETGLSEENTFTLRGAKSVIEAADDEEKTKWIRRLAPCLNIQEPCSPSSFYRTIEYCSNIFTFLNHIIDAYREDKAIKKSYISLCRDIYYSDNARYFGMSAVETKELICDRIGARIAKHLKETNLSDHPYDEERAIIADKYE